MPIDIQYVKTLLAVKDNYIFHRENQIVEYKEQFNLAGLGDYFRDFAAFANNRGGHMLFGIKDSPRIPLGLSTQSEDQFEKIDVGRLSGYLLDIFSADIVWEQEIIEHDSKKFGVFKIYEATFKPIIAKKDEGRDQIIKNGDIYYRYGGRTQKIMYAELENIINKRISQNNKAWIDLVTRIGQTGPQNAAILDTESGLVERHDTKSLLIDESLLQKIKFVKEGRFTEKDGAPTLKLIGDVVSIDKVEVVRQVKENLLKEYPLTATELVEQIKGRIPDIKQNQIWEIIKENDIKTNSDYSVYNFRSKKQEDDYLKDNVLPAGTPSIYKLATVDYIVRIIKSKG